MNILTADEFRTAGALIDRLEYAADNDAVIEIMNGVTGHMFLLLDEKPGMFDGNYSSHTWHSRLRRCRNSDRRLFEVLV